jgi:hypothetical protein
MPANCNVAPCYSERSPFQTHEGEPAPLLPTDRTAFPGHKQNSGLAQHGEKGGVAASYLNVDLVLLFRLFLLTNPFTSNRYLRDEG